MARAERNVIFVGRLAQYRYYTAVFLACWKARFAQTRALKLGTRLFTAYLREPYVFQLRNNASDLQRNINQECAQLAVRVLMPMVEFISSIFMLLGSSALLAPRRSSFDCFMRPGAQQQIASWDRVDRACGGPARCRTASERARLRGCAAAAMRRSEVLVRLHASTLSHVLFKRCARRASRDIAAASEVADFNAPRPYAIMHARPQCRVIAASCAPQRRIAPKIPDCRTGDPQDERLQDIPDPGFPDPERLHA